MPLWQLGFKLLLSTAALQCHFVCQLMEAWPKHQLRRPSLKSKAAFP